MTEEKLGYTGDPMVDRDLITIPEWERAYRQEVAQNLPGGTVFDSLANLREKQRRSSILARNKRRMQNVAIATGRVNGRFMKHGTPR